MAGSIHTSAELDDELRRRTATARLGGSEKSRQRVVDKGQLLVRDRLRLLLDDEAGLRGRAARPGQRRPARRRRGDGRRQGRRAHDVRHRQRLHRQGRHVGTTDVREDHPDAGARRPDRGAARVPRRRRRSPDRRAVRQLRRSPGVGQHLLQPDRLLRPGPPGLRPVRTVAGRVGLRPGAVRRHDHGPWPRHRLPRLAATRRDGDRRAGLARGDGRRRDALPRVGRRRRPRRRRRGGDRRRAAVAVVLPAGVGAAAAGDRRLGGRRRTARSRRSCRPARTSRSTCRS